MTEQLPHGYTNATRLTGVTDGDQPRWVVKSYRGPDADRRRWAEARALTRFARVLPVPGFVRVGEDLRLEWRPGLAGQEALRTQPERVLASLGGLARRLHALAPGEVHGDFGPQNVLVDPDSFEVTTLLDWELTGPGDPVGDLAWAEWIVRTHHRDLTAHLPALYAAYGSTPAWSERHAAMLAKAQWALDFVTRWSGPSSVGARRWRERIAATAAYAEQD